MNSEIVQSILIATTGNTLVLGVLGYLAKTIIQSSLSRDLERHKSALNSAAQKEMEGLRHELQRVAKEHEVVYGHLQEKRAVVIAGVYERLVRLYWAGDALTSPISLGPTPKDDEKFKAAIEASREFFEFFQIHRIYLPEGICAALDSMSAEMTAQIHKMGIYSKLDDEKIPQNLYLKKLEAWEKAWDHFQKNVPAAKKALEAELRKIIGDSTSSPTSFRSEVE